MSGERRWAVTQRLDKLDELLRDRGWFNRRDLMKAFGICQPQASTDIRNFLDDQPEGYCVYDKTNKRYQRGPSYPPRAVGVDPLESAPSPVFQTEIAETLDLIAKSRLAPIANAEQALRVAAIVLRRRAEQVGDQVCTGCGCCEWDACYQTEHGNCAWATPRLCSGCAESDQ